MERLRLALDASVTAAGFWRTVRESDDRIVDFVLVESTVGFEHWLGRPREEIVGRRYSELIPTGLHDRLPLYIKAVRHGEPVTVRFDRIMPDGHEVTAEVKAVPFGRDELFSALWDVSESHRRLRDAERAQAEALASRELLAAALNSSPDAFAIYDVQRDDGGVIRGMTVSFVNEVAAAPTGRAPDTWVGADVREWFPESGAHGLYAYLTEAASDLVPRQVTVSAHAPSGWSGEFDHVITPFGVDRVLTTWRPAGGSVAAPVEMPRDVQVSRYDALTGLLNRGEFRRKLADWLRSRRPGDPDGAVLVVDIDDFGRLNDLVGTQRADAVLATMAAHLRSLEPWLLFPARVGSDECACLLPGPADEVQLDLARAHASHILRQVAAEHGVPPIDVSGGLRAIEPGLTVDEILRDCDTALRHAVRAGGSRLTRYSEQVRHSLLVDYLQGEDIRHGLTAGEFELAYQPIVRIETGEHIGDEALARWRHPEYGTVTPASFISTAESTGVIVELGAWVIDRSVADLAEVGVVHRRQVGINVSGVQMLRSDLPGVIAAALERHHVSPERIVVEITESAILPDAERIRAQLAELRQMGVLVAIDDFGSGYSSIAYLDWIPVDVVKLDRQFLLGDLDRRRRSLISATAQLIRSIGARSLAEGIESAEQYDAAREAGVDFGQGYMFGRATLPVRTGDSVRSRQSPLTPGGV